MRKSSIIIVVLLILVIAHNWAIAVELDQEGCASYAVVSHNVIWARSVGADKEKVRNSIAEMGEDERTGVFSLVLKNFESLWTTYAPAEVVANYIYRDCRLRGGLYPDQI